jgi:hypothetical protein
MPRLVDFAPEWIDIGDRHGLGLMMDCGARHCDGRNAVLFANPLDGGPPFEGDTGALMDALDWDFDERRFNRGCGPVRWNRCGDTFDTLSLTPSVNAHECGHFTITNGGW